MLTQARNWLWLFPLLLLVTAPLWVPSLTDFLRPPSVYDEAIVQRAEAGKNRFKFDQVIITLSEAGQLVWTIKAEHAVSQKQGALLAMAQVRARHEGKAGAHIVVTAKEGSYQIQQQHLSLRKQVIVRRPAQQEVMFTEQLEYQEQEKMLISPTPVEIKTASFTIKAGHMAYHVVQGDYTLSQGVNCFF